MFKAIVRFSIRKKLFVGLTTLFLFIGGNLCHADAPH